MAPGCNFFQPRNMTCAFQNPDYFINLNFQNPAFENPQQAASKLPNCFVVPKSLFDPVSLDAFPKKGETKRATTKKAKTKRAKTCIPMSVLL